MRQQAMLMEPLVDFRQITLHMRRILAAQLIELTVYVLIIVRVVMQNLFDLVFCRVQRVLAIEPGTVSEVRTGTSVEVGIV
jgi:hypothetical protein